MSDTPTISVVLAVHNGEPYLQAALASILGQTMGDFELLVVDDGSTDRSAEIAEGFADPRLRVLRNAENLGHPASLNVGIQHARAPLIARMDADDIAEPQRFERQVQHLSDHPSIDVLGTWTTEIDEHDQVIGEFVLPPSEGLIRWAMTRINVIYHPSVMMRRRAVTGVGGYHENHCFGDDHILFNRLLMQGSRVAILPEKLLRYRRTSTQMTQVQGAQQHQDAMHGRLWYVHWLLDEEIPADVLERVGVLQVAMGEPPADGLDEALDVARRIREACLTDCDALGRHEINRRSRTALIYHARRLNQLGRTRDARLLWRDALRCGRTLTTDRRIWKLAGQITLGHLGACQADNSNTSIAGSTSS